MKCWTQTEPVAFRRLSRAGIDSEERGEEPQP